MSIPSSRQAQAFFSPLKRRIATFIVDGRETNAHFAKFLLGCACVLKRKTTILDTNIFYASNILRLTEKLPQNCLDYVSIRIPQEGSNLESWLTNSIVSDSQVMVLDNLNNVYNLLAVDDHKSASRRLHLIMRVLSFLSLTNDVFTISIAYRTIKLGNLKQQSGPRSLTGMSDLSAVVETQNSTIQFTCNHGIAWPNNFFAAEF